MGWNTGYTIFESTVIGTYDLGKLDKEMLAVLMEPYRNSDIDSGGSNDLTSTDGKTIEEVVIETWGLKLPEKPHCAYDDDPEMWDAYGDEVHEWMKEVTDHFGWC